MADEENKQEETSQEQPQEQAEETAAEATEAEQPAPAAEAPAADSGDEDGEKPTSKQLRKRARSTFSGPAREPVSAERRSEERKQARAAKAASRRRWRASRRAKKQAEPSKPAVTAAAEREPGRRKSRQGVVVSDKAEKTITVRIDNVRRHRVYGKVMHETTTLHAHDERNEAGEGDTVRVVECRPLSRSKRWRLVEVLEKAK